MAATNASIVDAKDIKLVLRFLRKSWYYLILFPALAWGLSYVYTYRLDDVYAATTQILIKSQETYDYQDPMLRSIGYYRAYEDMSNQMRLLRSRNLIEQTLANLLSKRRETQSEDLLEELHQGYAHAWSIFYTLLSDVEACKLLLQVGHTNAYAPIDKILHLALDEDLLFAFSHGTLAHLDRDLVLEAYFGAVTRGIGNLLTRVDKIAPETAADQLTQMCFAIMGLPHDPPPQFRESKP